MSAQHWEHGAECDCCGAPLYRVSPGLCGNCKPLLEQNLVVDLPVPAVSDNLVGYVPACPDLSGEGNEPDEEWI